MSIDISQFHQVFFEESVDHLAEMERLLLGMDPGSPDRDALDALFRAAHSVKGGAATFGFSDMAALTHVLESVLDRVRRGDLGLTDFMVDAFLRARDVIAGQLAAHRGDGPADPEQARQIAAVLEEIGSEGAPAAPAAAAPASAAEDATPAEVLAVITENAYGFFDEPPAEQAASAGDAAATAPEAGADDGSFGFFEPLPPTPAEAAAQSPEPQPSAERHGRRASDDPGAAAVRTGRRDSDKVAVPAAAESTSIRVGVEKVDQLINLVGELVITQSMLMQAGLKLDPVVNEKLLDGMSLLERNTRDLQEAVMGIRMVPMSIVFSRFPRLVRDLAGKLGKQVDLRTLGEGTELDKGLIEKITDPLTHLVRNSLDHGIEPPAQRTAAGKSARGSITLNAYHQGGHIVIEVSDDGRGLDRERILAKARERGLNAPDTMTDHEVWQLIFEAGFSTAEQVTDVSGRGVGMDVVKRNIEGLGGEVDIASASGYGTTITIRVPLTLAILDGMIVAVGDEIYIIPLGYVVESLQPAAADVKTVAGHGRVVRVRQEYLPLLALHHVFAIEPHAVEPEKGILVLLETNGRKVAVLVDELVGQQQVVVKNLEANYRRVAGISGATIMGDGRVALILDVASLVRAAGSAGREPSSDLTEQRHAERIDA